MYWKDKWYKFSFNAGTAVSDVGGKERASVVVDTVQKQAKQKADHLPHFRSDASKVTSKGVGLKRAHLHKSCQFTVNCGDAGKFIFWAINKIVHK